MHPSPSAETRGPFFPNFRYSMFPPCWGSLLRCSEFEERYGPGPKKQVSDSDSRRGRAPTRRFCRVPHPCASVSRKGGDFSSLFSNFDFLVSVLLARAPSLRFCLTIFESSFFRFLLIFPIFQFPQVCWCRF